ncbi:ATP-grasp domain-containing protein [Sphingobacterium sp. NPDC055346]
MKKALILGTNAGQADIINFLNEKGWETHACGYKMEGPGCELAHQFHLVNTTDIAAVKELATNLNVDIIYSVSSDSAITSATKASEELGLPHLLNGKLIDLFNNKHEFRDFLNKHDIGFTNYTVVTKENLESFTWDLFPCVVKPTNSQGQRGVQLIHDKESLSNALLVAFKSGNDQEAIIEEYLDGNEFSTNVVVQNGRIVLNEFSDRIVFGKEYFGLPKGHRIPITYINNNQLETAKIYVQKIIENLDIKDAVLYIQMKLKDNEPRVIEIAPRLDGCHIWRLIKHVREVDLRELAIKCLLKENIDIKPNLSFAGQSVLEFYHLPTIEKFEIAKLPTKEGLKFNEYRYKDGESIVPINGKLEVVGYCIFDEKQVSE